MTDVDTSSRKLLPPSKLTATASQPTMATRSSDPKRAPPESPRGAMTRKRAASINTEEANHPRIEDLSLNTPGTSSSRSPDQTKDLICLCTPAPKVPRPRNAFILYRQHHQGQVVAQNPGLANPEISKIIGEQWRDEGEEHKDQWRRLAEEEKQRHQRQYPDYRYQPRRGGKGVAARPSSTTGEDPGRCQKCGGRYIATPRTPSTPFIPQTAARANMPSYSNPNPRVIETDHLRHPSQASNMSMAGELGRGQNPYAMGGYHHLQGISEEYEIMSPSDAKRRRFNVTGSYQGMPPSPEPYGHGHGPHRLRHPSIGGPGVGPPGSYGHGPGGLLPGPSMLTSRAGSGPGPSMGPPPTRSSVSSYPHAHPHPRTPTPRSGSSFDESLRLPPLQTQLPTGPHDPAPPTGGSTTTVGIVATTRAAAAAAAAAGAGTTSAPHGSTGSTGSSSNLRESQARSIEAMVMSIGYGNKLRVLARISPPLAPPGPASPAVETRGAVVAVEGADAGLVARVGDLVERALVASGECHVRTWRDGDEGGGQAPGEGAGEGEGGQGGADEAGSGGGGGSTNLFGSYLRTIMEWHAKSAEMVRHITTAPPVGRSSDASSASAATSSSESGGPSASGSSNSGGGATISSQAKSSDGEAAAGGPTQVPPVPAGPTAGAVEAASVPPRQGRIPVALVKGGFSLSIADRFACRVPIADSYAPVDHWQWMATLWRGIVGPDLVVYVRGASEEEMARLQAVELKGPGIMMVRVQEGVGIAEKTERRLGFEIVEWVRAGSFSFKEGF